MPQEGEDGGGRPGDDGDDWLRRRRRRRGPSELASARRLDLCRGQPQRRMIFRLLGGIRGGDQGWSLLQRQPSRGRAEGDVGFNKSSSSNDYGCAIFCSNSLLHWHVIRGYLVASSTIFLLLEYHPYLQLEIALYYNAIFS